MTRRRRLPSSYRYKRAALGRDDAVAVTRPVQRPRVRLAARAPLMFVDCISVASVVVEAASRPRHLRALQMQKATAAYRSCIPQAREATTNRMKWELINGEGPARTKSINKKTRGGQARRPAPALLLPPLRLEASRCARLIVLPVLRGRWGSYKNSEHVKLGPRTGKMN